jgi:hypothetical protein
MTRDEQQAAILAELVPGERLETLDELAARLGVSPDELTAPYIEENGILFEAVPSTSLLSE